MLATKINSRVPSTSRDWSEKGSICCNFEFVFVWLHVHWNQSIKWSINQSTGQSINPSLSSQLVCVSTATESCIVTPEEHRELHNGPLLLAANLRLLSIVVTWRICILNQLPGSATATEFSITSVNWTFQHNYTRFSITKCKMSKLCFYISVR